MQLNAGHFSDRNQSLVSAFNEDFAGFKFTRFDGTPVHIRKMI